MEGVGWVWDLLIYVAIFLRWVMKQRGKVE